jgi:hypothetical protein
VATDLDNLKTRISAITAELAAGPGKPDYSLDGKSVSWNAYRKNLVEELKELREQQILFEGPTETHVQGTT